MKTEIIVITDRSGSMKPLQSDVIGGFNTFLAEQKKLPGEARMTYTQFDNVYEVVYAGKPLAEAPNLDAETYAPRGATALLDAIGRTLNEQGQRIACDKWAELVIVCVITDGEENSSREFTLARIREMTAHAEASGWKFVYLAANQDAFAAAANLGLRNSSNATYGQNAMGTQAAYASFSHTSTSLRAGGDGALSADLQRKLKDSVKATP